MTSPQELAAKYLAEDRLLDASRELKKVDKEALTLEEEKTIEIGEKCTKFVDSMKKDLDPSWTDLGETKKNGRAYTTAYNLDYSPVKVDFIIECPVEKSLVTPLIAVMNEIDLFPSWMPNWSKPKFRVVRAETLEKSGKCSQVFTLRTEAPLATVEFYVDATGVDDTTTNKEFLINMQELEPGDKDGMVPPPEEGVNRVTVGGGLTFTKCPEERAKAAKKLRGGDQDEDFVLISFGVTYQNKTKFLKPGFIVRKLSSFMLRVITGAIWSKMALVAEEARDGKRPDIEKKLKEEGGVYPWVESCIDKIVL